MDLKELKAMMKDIVGDVIAEKAEEARAKALEPKEPVPAFTRPQIKGFEKTPLSEKPVDQMTMEERGNMAGRCIRYLALAKADPFRAVEYAKHQGDKTVAQVWEKALGTDVFASGGALIPPEFAAGIIDTLHAQAVVRKMGCSVVPMNTGSLTMPYGDTGSTASYSSENSNITASEPTTGQLELRDKKLAVVVAQSNQLLLNGGAKADQFIKNDVAGAMGSKEDSAFIRSLGVSSEPKGMRYWADSSNVFAQSAATVAGATTDMSHCIRNLMDQNLSIERGGWLIAPRSWQFLMQSRDGNNNLVWAPEMKEGTLMGYPFAVTTNIPITLGGGSNESEVYFVDFVKVLIAENEAMRIEVFPNGAYYNNSAVVSGISQDQTVIRAIALHDFGARYRGKEISVITGVTWTA